MSFYIEPIIGFRSWKLVNQSILFLGSRVVSTIWQPLAKTEASCFQGFFRKCPDDLGQHQSPDLRCSCGLYGYYDQEVMETRSILSERAVRGAIVTWGSICLSDDGGFRAQYARPIALCRKDVLPKPGRASPYSDENLAIERVAENYKIPVLDPEDLTPYALTFGVQCTSGTFA